MKRVDKDQTCNGCKNWETWCLWTWAINDEECYKYIKARKNKLIACQKRYLINRLIELSGMTDSINKSKVSSIEIKKAIKEL